MSRSPYHPPFHRRMLPWLYVAVFLALAPVLVFYTAGYRYNPKKNVVERNGTLIIDSTPRKASVMLDGRDTGETTPVTLQNVAPGTHDLVVTRDGYRPWQRSVDIRAEQVTFVNRMWLWRDAAPTLLLEGRFLTAQSDPRGRRIALIQQAGTAATVRIVDGTSLDASAPLADFVPDGVRPLIRWNNDGTSFVVGGRATGDAAWWVRTPTQPSADPLTDGAYTWNSAGLTGTDGHTTLTLSPRSGVVERTALPKGTLMVSDGLSLLTGSSTREELLKDARVPGRVLQLPTGDWRLADEHDSFTLLRDQDRWIALHTDDKNPEAERADGDVPRWFGSGADLKALLLTQTEAWLWNPATAPTLIWRQSDPLVQSVWHRSGEFLFLADKTHVFALSLDDRGGRQTTQLATFDDIRDLTLMDRILYVSGTKDGKEGLWALQVE